MKITVGKNYAPLRAELLDRINADAERAACKSPALTAEHVHTLREADCVLSLEWSGNRLFNEDRYPFLKAEMDATGSASLVNIAHAVKLAAADDLRRLAEIKRIRRTAREKIRTMTGEPAMREYVASLEWPE